MAFLGCAMVAGYALGVETVYIASSYTFGQYIVCVSDPRIDNCVKCAGVNTIHDGYELSRQDKVKFIVDYHNTSKHDMLLRVCLFNTKNCCKYEKCFRSVLVITAEGGDVRKFGFDIKEPLKDFYEKEMEENMVLHRVEGEGSIHWPAIRRRMKDNYDMLNDEQKEFVDWLMSYDFMGKRKKSILEYRCKNIFKIIKRKLGL